MPLYPQKTVITVNGTKIKIQEGRNSFQDIIAAAKVEGASLVATPVSIVVTPSAVQATTIGPNHSYNINGGEVLVVS